MQLLRANFESATYALIVENVSNYLGAHLTI
jgi:hypothetical protein